MNVTSPISIPFYKGLSLIVEPGHEEHLRIALNRPGFRGGLNS